MSEQVMIYVAEDPKQPGAAFAACVDKPEYRKEIAKDIAGWIKRGAIIRRVDADTAQIMMAAWKRPEEKPRKTARKDD